MEIWRTLNDWALSPEQGLAEDEMMAHSVSENASLPFLHLYTFVPSVIVGRYQDLESSVNLESCKRLGVAYNRRHTGGGTVLMGPDQLAMGFAISLNHSRISPNVREIFQQLGGFVCRSLEPLGVNARFRPKNDLEVRGRKIAGLSASLEERGTLFFHCSLLLDFDIELMLQVLNIPREKISDKAISCFSDRMTTLRREGVRDITMEDLMEAVQRGFEKGFGVRFEPARMTSWEAKRVEALKARRYTAPEWIFLQRRPERWTGRSQRKTPGGLIAVHAVRSGKAIESVLITGDFFSTMEEINSIESRLKWIPAERGKVDEALREVMKGEAIFGVSREVLSELIMEALEASISPSAEGERTAEGSRSGREKPGRVERVKGSLEEKKNGMKCHE